MDIQLEPGVAAVTPVPPPPTSGNSWTAPSNAVWPPGIAPKPSRLMVQRLEGTPTTAGIYPVTLEEFDGFGTPSGHTEVLKVTVGAPDIVIPVPAAVGTEDGYMLPETAGVRWLVNGDETPPGSYSVQPVTEETTVTIIPEALAGYVFDAEPEPLVLTFEPSEDPTDPEDEWAELLEGDPQALFVAGKLADRALTHVGRQPADLTADELLTARDQTMTVLEYVKGYTRCRGFVGYIPHRSLQAVIVAAAGRLVTNPEQLTYYATGDYSERPATLTGWTMAELGVLRRFRRVYA